MILLLSLLLTLTLQVSAVTYQTTSKITTEEEKEKLANEDVDASFDSFWNIFTDVQPVGHRSSTDPETLAKERLEAKTIYTNTLNMVKNNNKQYNRGEVSYKLVINSFAVMNDENRKLYLGGGVNSVNHTNLNPLNDGLSSTAVNMDDYDYGEAEESYGMGNLRTKQTLDWRNNFPAVKNQGSCGSCWTYPASGLLEHAYKVCTGSVIALSEQELLDCTYEHANYNGCRGGWYHEAWKFIKSKGNHLATAASYAYRGTDSRCNYQHYSNALAGKVRLDSWNKVSPSSIVSNMQVQPLAVAFYVANEFHSVGSGIFNGYCRGQSNHAVILIGYAHNYWEIRNSWGANWGNRGYAKFQRSGLNSICNLLDDAWAIKWTDLNGGDNDGNDGNDGDDGDDGNCQDLEASCSGWRDAGYCTREYVEYMRDNCPMSCGYCDEGGDDDDDGEDEGGNCVDIHADCDYFTDQRYCIEGEWIQWMAENCAKSCGKCGDDDGDDSGGDCKDHSQYTNDCPGWSEQGFCKKSSEYYDWMIENCKKSCNTCDDDGGDEDACADQNDKCDQWRREGKCTSPPNRDYMLKNCKKSCNACEGEVTDEEIQLSYEAVSQSSTLKKATFAVDNADRTKSQTKCTNIAKKPAWFLYEVKVKSGNEAKITKVKVLNQQFNGKVTASKKKMLNKMNGATVQVKTASGSYKMCGTIRVNTQSGSKSDQTYTVDCGGTIGTHVMIEQKTKSFKNKNCLDIYEVEVHGFITGGEDKNDDRDEDREDEEEECEIDPGCSVCGVKMCRDGVCRHEHMCH